MHTWLDTRARRLDYPAEKLAPQEPARQPALAGLRSRSVRLRKRPRGLDRFEVPRCALSNPLIVSACDARAPREPWAVPH